MDTKFRDIEQLGKRSNVGILEGTVELSEKVDGACMGFFREKEGDPLKFMSRRIELNATTGYNGFYPGIQQIMEADVKNPFPPGKEFFGERTIKHSINYGKEIPAFIGFAVKDLETDQYEIEWYRYFNNRNIPIVPVSIVENPTVDELKEMITKKSVFGEAGATVEGIVIKNYSKLNEFGKQMFGKIVRTEFKEDAGRGKGTGIRKEMEEKYAKRFATPARIRKAVFRLRDENPDLEIDMPMMPKLILETSNDILKEEILTIAGECKEDFSFNRFRKAVSKECKVTLQDMIMEGATAV